MSRAEQIERAARALLELFYEPGSKPVHVARRDALKAALDIPADAEPKGVRCAVCGLALTEPPTVFVNVRSGAASSVPSLMKPAHLACVPSPLYASAPAPDRTQGPDEDAPTEAMLEAHRKHAKFAAHIAAQADALAVLKELVACKDLKDQIRAQWTSVAAIKREFQYEAMCKDYERRQPLAWAEARRVIAATSSDEGDSNGNV